MDNDIAIIKLSQSVQLGPYAQLACIPDKTDLPYESQYLAYNTSGITLGFDIFYTTDNVLTTNYLLDDYDLNIFNISNCSGMFPNTDDPSQIFCSGYSLTI